MGSDTSNIEGSEATQNLRALILEMGIDSSVFYKFIINPFLSLCLVMAGVVLLACIAKVLHLLT